MGLYLGSSTKLRLYSNDIRYCLNSLTITFTTNGIKLMSIDRYILKDSNGRYLTVKTADYIKLMPLDDYILQDADGLYLTPKEVE